MREGDRDGRKGETRRDGKGRRGETMGDEMGGRDTARDWVERRRGTKGDRKRRGETKRWGGVARRLRGSLRDGKWGKTRFMLRFEGRLKESMERT